MFSKADDSESESQPALYHYLKRREQMLLISFVGLAIWSIIRLVRVEPTGQTLFVALIAIAIPAGMSLAMFYTASHRREDDITNW